MKIIITTLILVLSFSSLAVSPYDHNQKSTPKWAVKARENIKGTGQGGLQFRRLENKGNRYPAQQQEPHWKSNTHYQHHQHWDFGMGM